MKLRVVLNIPLIYLAFSIQEYSCYFVQIVNMTKCQESDGEKGVLKARISDKMPFDQGISGKLTLPVDLDDNAVLQYKASALNADNNEWEVLYTGDRYVCNSLVKTLPYHKLADKTSFPTDCPIKKGTYEFEKYPISGQYVVFNTVRGVIPLVKHRIRLLQDKLLILCRVFFTMSHDS